MCNKINIRLFGLIIALSTLVGCSPIEGPRYWWDDQTKEKLANDYTLPESPPKYPVPTDPEPFVPKDLPSDEVQLATDEEEAQIKLGIPRAGVPDPLTNRVVVPAEKYVDETAFDNETPEEEEVGYAEEGLAEDEGGFSEEAYDDSTTEFADEEESVNDSGEAKDFIDEMDEDYNFNSEGDPEGADYNYKGDPTPTNSVYEREEVVTDTNNKLIDEEAEDDFAVGDFGPEDL